MCVVSATIFFWYYIWKSQFEWNGVIIVGCVVHIFSLLGFVLSPKVFSLTILLNYVAAAFLPDSFSQLFFFGAELAILFVGFAYSEVLSFLTVSMEMAALYLVTVLYEEPAGLLFTIGVPVVFAYCAGLVFRNMNLQRRKERDDAIKYHLSEKNKYIELLHDSVTGELSTIALLSRQAAIQRDPYVYQSILQMSEQALMNVHSLIMKMDDGVFFDEGESVQSYVAKQDLILAMLGYSGCALIDDGVEGTHELKLIVKEVYANIIRHGRDDGDYAMSIRLTDGNILIDQSNLYDKKKQLVSSGKGLHIMEKQIRDLEGEMLYWVSDDIWHLWIKYPIAKK